MTTMDKWQAWNRQETAEGPIYTLTLSEGGIKYQPTNNSSFLYVWHCLLDEEFGGMPVWNINQTLQRNPNRGFSSVVKQLIC